MKGNYSTKTILVGAAILLAVMIAGFLLYVLVDFIVNHLNQPV